jgi:1,2-diacylglycerol 3-alpha-glucosyltransferase
MTHLAVIFTNFGPYHLARLRSVDAHCRNRGWKLTGIELARVEADYDWRVSLSNLPFETISITEKSLESTAFTQLMPRLWKALNQMNPDGVAIAGYARPTMLSALLWSHLHRKPAILLSETTDDDAPRSPWKERLKGLLITQYQAALVGGQPQKRYLAKLGMPDEAIMTGYAAVGNDTFHPSRIKHLQRPLEKPYFLTINRFIRKKNLPFVINAYAYYRKISGEHAWDLVLIGDGELRSHLERQIQDLKLEHCIHLPGFLQQNEQLPYLAHAGCFIHASTYEQWGLVVNEAMAAGLPVLVSNRCSCFEDLVIEGINGFGFDPEDSDALTHLMLKMSSGNVDLVEMGNSALKHIQKFSPDCFAQSLLQSVEYALEKY